MNQFTNVIEFINDYTDEVKKCIKLLQNFYKTDDYFKAFHEKKIPRSGELPDGIEFQFHGIGCLFEFPNGSAVDFDWGEYGRYDGFDLWRLELFLEGRLDEYPHYKDAEILKKEFNNLIQSGLIKQVPNDNLYYFLGN
ncbi:MAG: hypothetical protein JWM09_451 [Francisellaceae bacterium]|nr:hypothetical protein [Francisellaceae bacterium]